MIACLALQRRSEAHRQRGEKGACATWTVIVAMEKCHEPTLSVQQIQNRLATLSSGALYCLVTCLSFFLAPTCPAH